jgi:hypothetical protein
MDNAIREKASLYGRRLEYFTIAWNIIEGVVGIVAGAIAGSISLVGFGIDSFLEVTSGGVLLWRMAVDTDTENWERNERLSLRIVGICFLALAADISFEAVSDLICRKAPEYSISGGVLACVSLVVMALLSRAKKRVGDCKIASANCLPAPFTRQARVGKRSSIIYSSRFTNTLCRLIIRLLPRRLEADPKSLSSGERNRVRWLTGVAILAFAFVRSIS